MNSKINPLNDAQVEAWRFALVSICKSWDSSDGPFNRVRQDAEAILQIVNSLNDSQRLPDAFSEVLEELGRATSKFPTWPTDPLHALAVLGEEFGELTKEMLQLTYEPHKSTLQAVRTEALQTAAMALRLFMSIDSYEYKGCHQHTQGSRV